jgi:Sulfatase
MSTNRQPAIAPATGPVAIASPLAHATVRVSEPDRSRTWRRLTLSSAALITVLDAALLQRKHALFTGGFLSSHQFGTLVDSAAFLGMSLLVNAAIAAPLTLTALAVGRRLRLRAAALQFAASWAAVLPLVVADFVSYGVWSYLGDAFDFHVMFALTGHRLSEIFAVAAPLMSRPLIVFVLAMSVVVGITGLLQRFDRRDPRPVVLPTRARILNRCLTLAALASVLVASVSMTSDSMAFALRRTPSGQLFTMVLDRVSDIDRDGYGSLRHPKDAAAFDASIFPYALDIPANGIDENALGGDLPADKAVYSETPQLHAAWPRRPPVILFVLESVRADAVGAFYKGRRVTPVMDALAAEGLRVDSAWAHSASTVLSRYHLLTGSLIDGRGNSTLLDDFKNQGYEVGYFSGQDDHFGSMWLEFSRADKFYDARQDLRSRYSTSTTPGSLAVPHTIVERRLGEYLAERRREAPLFLYVNFHDTHYPYDHPGLENLLGVERLPASHISPSRRADLMGTYLNATANVDRAIGRVIDAVAAHVGQQPAVIVVSDHGESLFEQGFLGHGFALTDAQTRIPLIVKDLPANVTMPFGLADVRRMINEALASAVDGGSPPVAHVSRSARVFQFLGALETPSQIGWMTTDGSLTYDFRSERIGLWDGAVSNRDLTGAPKHLFEELVFTWESMLLARSQRTSVAQ